MLTAQQILQISSVFYWEFKFVRATIIDEVVSKALVWHPVIGVNTVEVRTPVIIITTNIEVPDVTPGDFPNLEHLRNMKARKLQICLFVFKGCPLSGAVRNKRIFNVKYSFDPIVIKIEAFKLKPVTDAMMDFINSCLKIKWAFLANDFRTSSAPP